MATIDPIIYAVGDIHGYAALLDDLLQQIERDAAKYKGRPIEIVFVGDYVDRGPDSRGVIARLRSWQPGFALTFLKGNHEHLLAEAIMDPSLEFGADMGQDQTFESYFGHDDDLAADIYWMNGLPLTKMLESGGKKFLFVHAGIIPGRALDDQPEHALIWIRDEFLNHKGDHGFTVVHGHTPNGTGWPEVKANRINVDSGVFFAGRLSAVVLGDGQPRFLHAVATEGWDDDV
jgi:serine/threonine protein phosphatase 1